MTEVFLGQIMLTGFNFAPRGFATCDGQLLPIAQNQALFALLGTQYGGNGTTTFGLPDLRGRTPRGFTQAEPVGVASGVESVTLTPAQLPTHTHRFVGTTAAASTSNPRDALFAASGTELYAPPGASVTLAANTVESCGNDAPHNNMQPYSVLNFCIALTGVFPSRN
ncbi:tail fiber protein [Lysobacter sp. F60174L2]|uniref:tail fiber protein n=1 Tax=Lysobacter sp. F60174L2 TaxID=3459295 RepID=UPI00403D8591